MGKCKDVTQWQKGTIVFGRAHDHTMSEVAGFVGVSQRTVKRVYNQRCNTRGHINKTSELWSAGKLPKCELISYWLKFL